MFNLMIVDDNKTIRNGIKSILRTSNIEIDSVYEASNGKEAIQLVQQRPISIIITDIRMPEMDGIELMREVTCINEEIEFIVISGYDDFKYAQQSIVYGAKAYLLKPINKIELLNTLKKMKTVVQYKENSKKTEELVHKKLLEIKQNELKQYILGIQAEKDTVDNLVESFEVLQKECYLMVIGFKRVAMNHTKTTDFLQITQEIRSFFESQNQPCIICRVSNYIVLIANQFKLINGLIQKLKYKTENYIIAISNLNNHIEKLPATYQKTIEIYNHHYLFPEKVVFTRTMVMNLLTEFTIPKNNIEYLVQNIGKDRSLDLTKYINDIFNRNTLIKYHINYTVLLCEAVYCNLLEIVKVIEPYSDHSFENFKKIKNIYNYDSIRDYLKDLCLYIEILNRYFYEFKTVYREKDDLNKALEYIHGNYQQDINLAVVSNVVSLNYSYFSNIFKKHTGETFVKYLRDLRLEKAKELLMQTDFMVSEIANKVGYDNYKTFARLFKHSTGVSPMEYRFNYNITHKRKEG